LKRIAAPFTKALREAIVIPPQKCLALGAKTLLAYGKPYLFLEANWYQERCAKRIERVLLDVVVFDGKLQRCITIDGWTFVEDASLEDLVKIAQKQLC